MRRRTSKRQKRRCLLCSGPCLSSNPLDRAFEIPGAAYCSKLGSHLEKIFILRQLLDIPVSWCEETLQRTSTNKDNCEDDKMEHVDMNSGADSIPYWFTVCSNCMKTEVRKAWEIYQKLVEIQSKFNVIKMEIKNKMRNGLEKFNDNGLSKMKFPRSGSLNIQDDIQDLLFPAIRQEMQDVAAEMLFEDDSLPTSPSIDVTENIDIEYEEPVDNDIEYKPKTKVVGASSLPEVQSSHPRSLATKRRRGRPKKGECRPLRNPLLYYTHYGNIKKIAFKWKKCTLCSSKYKREEDLKSHLEMHEKSRQNGGGQFDCSICKFPARDKAELDMHSRNRHQRAASQLHDCPKCDFSTRVWKVLKLHVSQYHDVVTAEEMDAGQKVMCSACPAVLTNKRYLSIHQKKCHPELVGILQEATECDQCKMRFASQQELDAHTYNVHNREARYVCDICGKGFPFKSRLESHKTTHQERNNHVCHICGCDYSTKWVLDLHIKKFHSEVTATSSTDPLSSMQEKEIQCKHCDFRTPHAMVLRRHYETHKQEWGHKCSECGKCYANEQGLKRHLRINHPVVKEDIPCPHCFRTFPSVEYMKDHVKLYCKLKNFIKSDTASASVYLNSTQ